MINTVNASVKFREKWRPFAPVGPADYYFDVTTWLLVCRVAPRLRPEERVLDLGTGAHATVGICLR